MELTRQRRKRKVFQRLEEHVKRLCAGSISQSKDRKKSSTSDAERVRELLWYEIRLKRQGRARP